jgi:rod shape determining protein RodA
MKRVLAALRQADWLFLFSISTLIVFGLSAIYSITLSLAGSSFQLVEKQLVAAVIGIVLFVFVTMANYRLLRSYARILYGLSVASLIAVLIFGVTIRGTTGWFDLGGFHFQPVEFAKLALIVVLAHYFSDRARRELKLKECFESGVITAVPVVLTLLQPDLGSALLLLGIWGLMLLFAGLKKRYVAAFMAFAAGAFWLAWEFLFADFQRARILTFINPANDPLGQGYNVRQAMIGVGSGEWFGRGLGFGSQSQLKFIPESQTDFIFAVVAEDLGFVGVVLILSAFFLLFKRILRHASATRDDFTSYLILGIGGVIFLQFVVNVGMNLGLLPVTGIALPLVSYGGSSLVVTLIMLGIVESAAVRFRATHVIVK